MITSNSKNINAQTLFRWLLQIILFVVTFVYLFPFIWMVLTSIKAPDELLAWPPKFFPQKAMWINYKEVLEVIPLFRMLFNTLFVSVSVTFGQLIFCSMAGFSFARLRFPGRELLFTLYLSTMMVPFMVTIIPLFIIMRQFDWINTYAVLIVPGFFGSAFGTFLMRQFFKTLPVQLEEAAYIDGASTPTIFFRIFIPLTKPVLAALAIFTLVGVWNDLLWPLITIQSDQFKTITAGLATFQGKYGGKYQLLMAGTVISITPIAVAFVFAQKYFIEGITFTGMKG